MEESLEAEPSPAEMRGSDDSGEELYSQVLALLLNHTVLAGKVTGVLLDLGQSEVDHLLQDQEWMQVGALEDHTHCPPMNSTLSCDLDWARDKNEPNRRSKHHGA